jgi:hypothetical protein
MLETLTKFPTLTSSRLHACSRELRLAAHLSMPVTKVMAMLSSAGTEPSMRRQPPENPSSTLTTLTPTSATA